MPTVRAAEFIRVADAIAPIDADAFSRRAGELIRRKKAETVTPTAGKEAETVTPTAGKYRLRALQCFESAQSRDSYAKDVLTELAREFLQAARQAEGEKAGGF
jgi:hypothetical protein